MKKLILVTALFTCLASALHADEASVQSPLDITVFPTLATAYFSGSININRDVEAQAVYDDAVDFLAGDGMSGKLFETISKIRKVENMNEQSDVEVAALIVALAK